MPLRTACSFARLPHVLHPRRTLSSHSVSGPIEPPHRPCPSPPVEAGRLRALTWYLSENSLRKNRPQSPLPPRAANSFGQTVSLRLLAHSPVWQYRWLLHCSWSPSLSTRAPSLPLPNHICSVLLATDCLWSRPSLLIFTCHVPGVLALCALLSLTSRWRAC
jgi:hypothetical protein